MGEAQVHTLSGSIESNSLLDLSPAFYSNNYLKLDYSYGRFSAGIQAEYYPNPLPGYDAGLKGIGLPGKYIAWTDTYWNITAGDFYDQFGTGIIFRSWEDRNLGWNNSLGGGRVGFSTPGEVFSFWRLVGKTTEKRGYKNGRVIIGNKIVPGLGGGLCNLGHTIHRIVLHSPLEVTEFHSHSDALGPDEGPRVPFGTGTSICYNHIDFRFRNTTDQDVQLIAWCQDGRSYAELRSERPFPWRYSLVEEDLHFRKEGEKYYRNSKIYRETIEKESETVIRRELVFDNHSEVMFDYALIPPDQIRGEEAACCE